MKKITVLALSLVLLMSLATGCRRGTDGETSMPVDTDPLDTTYHTHPSTQETTRPSTQETTRPSTQENTLPSTHATDPSHSITEGTENNIPGEGDMARRRGLPVR